MEVESTFSVDHHMVLSLFDYSAKRTVRLWWLKKEDSDFKSTVLSTGANWSTGVRAQKMATVSVWQEKSRPLLQPWRLQRLRELRRLEEVPNGVIADWRVQRDKTKSIRT